MTCPFVSFVFPVAPERVALELLRRSVRALRAQTADPDAFEVVIAVDGGLGADVDVGAQPFDVRVVPSPRTPDNEHIPHRNHARNAACRSARGEYLWVLDADMLADPHAVDHLLAVVTASGKPRVVTPCFAEIACTPAEWLASELETIRPLRKKTASGQLGRHAPGPPSSTHLPMIPEGFPALPRWLFDAVGGFDERYLGWGGNKIDLCRRCRMLDMEEHLLEVHLLTSVLFRHQPHERDPLHFDDGLRARNTEMFERMQLEAAAGAPWWRAQVEAVQSAMQAAA